MAADAAQEPHLYAGVIQFVSRNVVLSLFAFVLLLFGEFFAPLRSYLVSAGMLCGVLAILLTYSVGGKRRFSKDWSFFQPLKGGARFVVFQVIGWTFFATTILLPWVPWLLAWQYPQEAARVLVIGAGVSSIVGEIMMVCSLLTYDRPSGPAGDASLPQKQKQHFKEFLRSRRGYRVWTAFIGLQALLSIFACTLAAIADTLVSTHFARLVLVFFAVMCFSLSLFLTYGIGGRWKYYTTDWRFYQPFSGGKRFVLLQALCWAFFSIAMLVYLLHMYDMLCAMTGMRSFIPFHTNFLPSFFGAAISGVLAQVLNALSLFVYSGKLQSPSAFADDDGTYFVNDSDVPYARAGAGVGMEAEGEGGAVGKAGEANTRKRASDSDTDSAAASSLSPSGPFVNWVPSSSAALRQLCFVVMLFNLEKWFGFFMLFSLLFADIAPNTVVASWVILIALYFPTYIGYPSRSGSRSVLGLRGHWFFDDIASFFRLRLHVSVPLDARHKYIFGFHPHGILPITCGWMHFTSMWKKQLPGITPAALTSSVVHYVPFMRDILQFMSGLEVSREGYAQALRLHRSAIVVPGGQREMLESRSEDRDIVVYTGHKGFLRLAMELAVNHEDDLYVVPVYSFGETQLLDNLPLPLALQRWCINKLRANVFFFPYGMLGLPGVPRPEHLSVAIGKPVLVPKVAHPSSQQVDVLHRRFHTELHAAFERFKVDAKHGTDNMLLSPPVEHLHEDQFEEAWKECKTLASDAHSSAAAHHRSARKSESHSEQAFIGMAMVATFLTVVYQAYF